MAARELIAVPDAQGRARGKDVPDFEELLRRYGRQVIMTALRILGNRADAEDASQEVFLRLHKYWRRFDPARAIEPWLYRMAVNAALDLRRKRRELPLEPMADLVGREDSGLAVDRADQRDRMRRALQELPEKMRAAVVLRDIEGLTTKQVAEILGSTETTVRSQISVARLRLREIMRRGE